MYSRLLFFFVLATVFTSCSSEKSDSEEDVIYADAEVTEVDTFPYDSLSGIYSGEFGGSNIRIVMNYVSSKNAVGYNIHLGLQRNISGKVERSGDTIHVSLAEPGDHPYDGVFQLTFIGDDDRPEGVWKSNNGKISDKKFSLKKYTPSKGQNFKYGEKVTLENFTLYFADALDTIGEYTFQPDGLVIFTYYPGGAINVDYEHHGIARVEQSKTIQGNWTIEGEKVTLSWEDNSVFPKQKMIYFVKQEEYETHLAREDNPIRARMYPQTIVDDARKMFYSILKVLCAGLIVYASYLLILLSLPYIHFKPGVEFLATKQLIYHIDSWRISFYTHVFTSPIVILAGLLQFNRKIIHSFPRFHRVVGKIYIITVLFISGPSALVMAFYANGGYFAQISFVLLSLVWILSTYLSYYFARKGNFSKHANWSIRSYALTLSAVTLRFYAYLFDVYNVSLPPRETYILLSYLSWIPNLVFAQLLIRLGFANYLLSATKR